MRSAAIKNRTDPAGASPTHLRPVDAVHDVSVIGLGYVGLPTAAVLAHRGLQVAGIDIRPDVVQGINAGEVHLDEPDLAQMVGTAVCSGELRAFAAPVAARAHLICVPTPFDERRRPDLRHVDAAVSSILPVIRPGDLVVLESTVPPGTTRQRVAARLEAIGLRPGKDVFVAHAPERILPGAILRELVHNPRVVGGVTRECTRAAVAFYERMVDGPIHATGVETAELAKLAENSFRDVNVAFANELANVCEQLGADVWDVIRVANHHPRVEILRPGPGVGGHCIAVDPWFLVASSPEHTPLLRTAREVNDGRIARVVAQVRSLARHFVSPRIACLGLSYKPGVADLRNSAALAVAQQLVDASLGRVMLVEPHLSESPIADTELCEVRRAVTSAEIVVILVAHDAFRGLPRMLFEQRAVVDTVGLLREA